METIVIWRTYFYGILFEFVESIIYIIMEIDFSCGKIQNLPFQPFLSVQFSRLRTFPLLYNHHHHTSPEPSIFAKRNSKPTEQQLQ